MGAFVSPLRSRIGDAMVERVFRLVEPKTPLADRFPDAVVDVLTCPDEMQLLSLNPDPRDGGESPSDFHGHERLGRVTVGSRDERVRIGTAIVAGNRRAGPDSECFDPTVGLLVRRGDERVTLAACFACGNVEVIGPGDHRRIHPLAGWVARPLLRHLRAGGVRVVTPP